jgi:hypothetical protein
MANYKGNNVETLTHSKKVMLDRASEGFNANSEGPFKTALDKMEGVFRKELVNYKVQDGFLVKEVSVRDFRDNDYHDTTTVQRIAKVQE